MSIILIQYINLTNINPTGGILMIGTLIAVQTICISVSAYLTYKTTKKTKKMVKVNSTKGFKYYKAGGF